MFQNIHLLPLYNPKERNALQDRWETKKGREDQDYIIEKIKRGAGEDFLQGDFESGRIPTMKDDHDLKGINIWSLDIEFPKSDNFEAIDFSYSKWWHSNLKNGLFYVTLSFARVYNCEFKNCTFYFFDAYGTVFEKCKFINCDFIEHSSFTNSEFSDCLFDNCFYDDAPFRDCRFDSNTEVEGEIENIKIINSSSSSIVLEKKTIPQIYKSIKDGYLSGEVYPFYRKYFFLQKKSERKIVSNKLQMLNLYLQEVITGYGVKPENTVIASFIAILLFSLIFTFEYKNIDNSILQSLSAFTTVGNAPSVFPYNYLFFVEALCGIGLFALFITVLSNVWFSEK